MSSLFRSTLLDSAHYAGRWAIPTEDQRNNLADINQLGYTYALAGDSAVKEAQLLTLLEAFHGYLMKYLCMVLRGTIPPENSHAGKDAKEFLRQMAPKGSRPSDERTLNTCKMIHLAFKGMTTEDIYDTLSFCFVKAARRYDPHYAAKTKKVCEEISELSKGLFTVAEIELRVGFPCTGILRMLVRKGFLASITGKKKVVGYQLGAAWPAPAAFFESGPMGFVYILQLWFRYYLNEYVTGRMSEIESNDGVLQLGDVSSGERSTGAASSGVMESIQSNAEGNCVNATRRPRGGGTPNGTHLVA